MATTHQDQLVSIACVIGLSTLVWSLRKNCQKLDQNRNDLKSWIADQSVEPPCYDNPNNSNQTQQLNKESVHKLRDKHFCASQSVSYSNSNPLMIVRGNGSKLYDENNVEYLDTRNNVGHVGHSHPKVVYEIAKQAAAINTNTRYLHPNHVRLADKLLQKCPSPLKRVFFVNSGSEANDLALRLSRAYTKKKHVIVVEHAYHGHTVEAINISPYKFAKAGGVGQQPWVHVVSAPDIYRGVHRTTQNNTQAQMQATVDEETATKLYSKQVLDICAELTEKKGNDGLAAFFIESGMSVAGVILPPEGYLKECFEAVRKVGALCIADEVQVGFGRFGDSFWAFEHGGVVPDIVTCGKPFGNGMPLAAVITTDQVANAFESEGIEYFNTFGGNPVSCAAGLAVLDALEQEHLMENAAQVGKFLRSELVQLSEKTPYIGNIRGRGLFIGIDFVVDKETRTAAPAHASTVTTRLKEKHHILTSIDGPHNNVIVMKPPMVFSLNDAKQFLACLEECLTFVDHLGDAINQAKHTPT
mmetsp:Transcript_7169/g.9294  ORF Transcript_7169/g.9294 Transcript_7169/m.9294 type:complete len:528 (-) Transcript_7169:195-1778(-)